MAAVDRAHLVGRAAAARVRDQTVQTHPLQGQQIQEEAAAAAAARRVLAVKLVRMEVLGL